MWLNNVWRYGYMTSIGELGENLNGIPKHFHKQQTTAIPLHPLRRMRQYMPLQRFK